jgi:phosphopantetheinyl transferase (holo-ACP synthase)
MASPPEQQLRVGVDLVDVQRLRRLLAAHSDRHEELFTTAELDYCRGIWPRASPRRRRC